MLSSPHIPVFSPLRDVRCAVSLLTVLLGFWVVPSLAAAAGSTNAGCSGQSFVQPFTAFKDSNFYTLVNGSEFATAAEGWELSGGAQVISTTYPDATTGGVLDLPSGSKAVSPPVCVTLLYPTARVWVRDVKGSEGVAVDVSYAGTVTAVTPKNVGQVHGQQTNWTLSNPINVQPQTAGPGEEARTVRFVFIAGGKTSDFQVYDLYVDPRMR